MASTTATAHSVSSPEGDTSHADFDPTTDLSNTEQDLFNQLQELALEYTQDERERAWLCT